MRTVEIANVAEDRDQIPESLGPCLCCVEQARGGGGGALAEVDRNRPSTVFNGNAGCGMFRSVR